MAKRVVPKRHDQVYLGESSLRVGKNKDSWYIVLQLAGDDDTVTAVIPGIIKEMGELFKRNGTVLAVEYKEMNEIGL